MESLFYVTNLTFLNILKSYLLFLCSVLDRCIPKNITSIIDIAKANGVDQEEIEKLIETKEVEKLIKAVVNIETIADIEKVCAGFMWM